jgi:2-polyprenyl-3-methyl-5-hydroxy-6-metoxy-1,4-benzoquinol methylase
MTSTTFFGIQRRACPICDSSAKTALLTLDADAIFRSNWSYRADAKALLALGANDRFPIVECGACRFIYADQLPDTEFLHRVYDQVIDSDLARRDNLSPAQVAAKMDSIATLLRLAGTPTEPLRVLDYGCGFGATLALLAAVGLGVQAVGYETSAGRLADLQARGLTATGDVGELMARGPFDIVILDNVLEHVPHPRETVAAIEQACAAGALLYVSVPETDRQRVLAQQRVADAGGAIDMDVNPWEHLNYFDVKHLDALLAESAFEPMPAARLPQAVDIGVRPSESATARMKNALASLPRLASYVMHGDTLPRATRRFYRLARDGAQAKRPALMKERA